jgi:hypothetical protein
VRHRREGGSNTSAHRATCIACPVGRGLAVVACALDHGHRIKVEQARARWALALLLLLSLLALLCLVADALSRFEVVRDGLERRRPSSERHWPRRQLRWLLGVA